METKLRLKVYWSAFALLLGTFGFTRASASPPFAASQPQLTISGTVHDEAGRPQVGASVAEKGTANVTQTDVNGAFSIRVADENAVLVFSYIGYATKEIPVAGQARLTVTLEPNADELDEVVIIGYGTQKKANLTAAVEMVDMKVLENRPVKSVGEMLQGTVPGLNVSVTSGAPDATPDLNIRGFTGLNESRGPLVLVDGVEQNINSLNPADIENISVLKDAAASAIYGSRAPFGVILITTKGGKKGAPLRIDYSSTVQMNQPFKLPHTQNSLDYVLEGNRAFYNDGQTENWPQETIDKIRQYMAGQGPNNTVQPDGTWGAHTTAHGNTDYVGEAFKKQSYNHTQNLAMRGGSENISYYLGLGWNSTEGTYKTDLDKFDRYNATLKMDADLADWVNVGSTVRYAKIKTMRPNYRGAGNSDGSDGEFWNAVSYWPNVPIKNPDGNYHWLSAFPMLDGAQGVFDSDADELWLIPNVTLRPMKDLKIYGQYSFNINTDENLTTTKEVMVRDANGVMRRSARSATFDALARANSKKQYYQLDINAEYQKTLGRHFILGLVGMQQEKDRFRMMDASRNDLYSTDFPVLGNAYGDNFTLNERYYEWANRGYYGRISYNYDGKYLFDFNGRYDGSSRFRPETRWSFLPSVSVGYNVHKEAFWPFASVFDTFKLMGSWGRTGNPLLDINGNGSIYDLVDLYTYLPVYQTFPQTTAILEGTRLPAVAAPNPTRADRTWEKPQSIGFGIESGFFGNRLGIDYNWYQRTTYDALGTAELLPEVLGAPVPVANNAITETRGWELAIRWRDEARRNSDAPLRYGIRFNLSDYIGYVVNYGPGNEAGLVNGTWTPGQVFQELFGYRVQGIAQNGTDLLGWTPLDNGYNYPGDVFYQDLDGDGQIGGGVGGTWYSRGDQVSLGYQYPRLRYGVVADLGWKNFSLSVVLDGVGKEVKWVNNTRSFGHASATNYASRTAYDLHGELGYWRADYTDAFFPRVYQGGKNTSLVNDRYVMDLSHLRLKNVNLSYALPAGLLGRLAIKHAVVNVSIENMGFIYYNSWLDLDPALIRRDVSGYPTSRTVSLGLNVGF